MLVPARDEWPQLRISVSVADSPLEEERLTDERADLRLRAGGRVEIVRATGTAQFVVPRALTDDELVHPGLAPAAAVMSHGLERPCFHAGAFIDDGAACAVAGDREAGKSSMLAWLAAHERRIVADDVLVLARGPVAYAGPRSLDLREETAQRIGAGDPVGHGTERARWRLTLSAVDGEVPLRGWFFLAWANDVAVRRLTGSECLMRLLAQLTVRVRPTIPELLLELAALPAWELRRPRDWEQFGRAGKLLLDVAAKNP
jgi:hypothetical protein